MAKGELKPTKIGNTFAVILFVLALLFGGAC